MESLSIHLGNFLQIVICNRKLQFSEYIHGQFSVSLSVIGTGAVVVCGITVSISKHPILPDECYWIFLPYPPLRIDEC